jgi:hypothetical protein
MRRGMLTTALAALPRARWWRSLSLEPSGHAALTRSGQAALEQNVVERILGGDRL